MHCRDATASSSVTKVQGKVFAHFHAVAVTVVHGMELTVWPARTNSLWTIPLMSKKMMSMLLTLLFTCLTFFSLGEFALFHWEDCCLVLGSLVITLDKVASLEAIWRSPSQTLTRYCLWISCQTPGHKFGGDRMHAQLSSQNPLACPITNYDFISKVLNGLMSVLTNKLLKYGNSVERCTADGPTCMLVVLNGCPTGP
jgi:hypothetical protein